MTIRPLQRLQSTIRRFILLAAQYPDLWGWRTYLVTWNYSWEVWIDFSQGKRSWMHHMHIKRSKTLEAVDRKERPLVWLLRRMVLSPEHTCGVVGRGCWRRNTRKWLIWLTLIFNWILDRRSCFMFIKNLWTWTGRRTC